MIKLHEYVFKIISHPPYFVDLAFCDYFLLADSIKSLQIWNKWKSDYKKYKPL